MRSTKASPVQGEVSKIYLIFDGGVVQTSFFIILFLQSLSHAVRVTAPFTQGSLGRCRAIVFFDKQERPVELSTGVFYFAAAGIFACQERPLG